MTPPASSAPDRGLLEAYGAVRFRAAGLAPYLATAIYAMRPVAAPGLDTFACDASWRIYLDAGALERWGPLRSAAVVVHEVNHLLRRHAERGHALGSVHPGVWNLAADCEINDDLAGRVPIPDEGVTPETFGLPDGRLAEEYVRDLLRLLPPACPTCGAHRRPGAGPAEGSTERSAEGSAGPSWPQAVLTTPCPTCGAAIEIHRGCGSGAGGAEVTWELPSDHPTSPGLDGVHRDLLRRKVALDIREHQHRHGPGSLPEGLRSWAEGTLSPARVPWQRLLSSVVRRALATTAGQVDFTYHRLSRRQAGDVILPAMGRPSPTVATIVDTSGSMSAKDLRTAVSEVQGICRDAGVRGDRHHVLAVDDRAGAPQRVDDAHRIELTGGGGTDLRLGLEAAVRLHPRPDVVVALTDGETPWPSSRLPHGIRLIVVLIGATGSRAGDLAPPAWADVVELADG